MVANEKRIYCYNRNECVRKMINKNLCKYVMSYKTFSSFKKIIIIFHEFTCSCPGLLMGD